MRGKGANKKPDCKPERKTRHIGIEEEDAVKRRKTKKDVFKIKKYSGWGGRASRDKRKKGSKGGDAA